MKHDLWLKQPLKDGEFSWETNFDGQQPLMEYDLQWKTIFDEKHPLWKTNLN